jgi:3-oxoacyl-[acyl-carrier protein] reductase
MEDGHWRRTLAIHLDGTFYCTREALKIMEFNGWGVIINMASIAALTGIGGAPDYSAAKGGIMAFTKSVAREVIGRGIRVNAIAPGYIANETTQALAATGSFDMSAINRRTPMGRFGTEQEVAEGIGFLLAPGQASYVTGHTLEVNGGWTAYGFV